ncbi:hypothetical protein K438DRAFT_1775372 [Mycena galopus ATCC 62051]|nr:hypothetical protein K438DRAFT_1775372 [Mycena galopus ATCC 62051]
MGNLGMSELKCEGEGQDGTGGYYSGLNGFKPAMHFPQLEGKGRMWVSTGPPYLLLLGPNWESRSASTTPPLKERAKGERRGLIEAREVENRVLLGRFDIRTTRAGAEVHISSWGIWVGVNAKAKPGLGAERATGERGNVMDRRLVNCTGYELKSRTNETFDTQTIRERRSTSATTDLHSDSENYSVGEEWSSLPAARDLDTRGRRMGDGAALSGV